MTTNASTATVASVDGAGRSKRLVTVRLDDGRAFTVPVRSARDAGVTEGVTLLPAAIDALAEEELATARQRAMRRMASSDRTEQELRSDLAAQGFSKGTIEETIGLLREQRLLDDQRSADAFVLSRTRSQPRSKRMLRAELRARGVDPQTAEAATAEIDDEEAARDLAERRALKAPRDSYEAFSRHVGAFLQRRGFGRETSERAVDQAWASVAEADGHET